jgi:hypothetical protein
MKQLLESSRRFRLLRRANEITVWGLYDLFKNLADPGHFERFQAGIPVFCWAGEGSVDHNAALPGALN